jgi:hypothetical protein
MVAERIDQITLAVVVIIIFHLRPYRCPCGNSTIKYSLHIIDKKADDHRSAACIYRTYHTRSLLVQVEQRPINFQFSNMDAAVVIAPPAQFAGSKSIRIKNNVCNAMADDQLRYKSCSL